MRSIAMSQPLSFTLSHCKGAVNRSTYSHLHSCTHLDCILSINTTFVSLFSCVRRCAFVFVCGFVRASDCTVITGGQQNRTNSAQVLHLMHAHDSVSELRKEQPGRCECDSCVTVLKQQAKKRNKKAICAHQELHVYSICCLFVCLFAYQLPTQSDDGSLSGRKA
jgi:hypothetical protein